ncbi:hypothetical protein ABID21_003796 [Pseudorhizobium tarimense]|uniref:Uncharacterized protein n=1 Tax=Pseudorhizobium tarimense TaxID=1079109 RepID=A0ABV2HAW6_9HYPH|nr:hypothetical protein [Pseudorhizobium tarimense]MCJ8520792.1 hypothetical protein [Pseudorhizobium tarimense]
MKSRTMAIVVIVAIIAIAIVAFLSRPFQQTVVEEDPGQAPPHAIDQ